MKPRFCVKCRPCKPQQNMTTPTLSSHLPPDEISPSCQNIVAAVSPTSCLRFASSFFLLSSRLKRNLPSQRSLERERGSWCCCCCCVVGVSCVKLKAAAQCAHSKNESRRQALFLRMRAGPHSVGQRHRAEAAGLLPLRGEFPAASHLHIHQQTQSEGVL